MALWASGTTYPSGAPVTGSNGVTYLSLDAGNIGHDPTATTGFWTRFAIWTGQTTWSQGAWMLDILCAHAVGDGLVPVSAIGSDKIDTKVKALWNEWQKGAVPTTRLVLPKSDPGQDIIDR